MIGLQRCGGRKKNGGGELEVKGEHAARSGVVTNLSLGSTSQRITSRQVAKYGMGQETDRGTCLQPWLCR